MAVLVAYPHIVKPENGLAHLKRIQRVCVSMIVKDYLFYGWSVEEKCRQHPYLKPSEAFAAMGYYFDHRQEIDEELRHEIEEIEQATFRDAPLVARMRASGKL